MKEPLVTISNLSFSYNKKYKSALLSRIDLTIYRHELVSIFGKNGSGKSTFLNILAGFINPKSGQIKYFINKPIKISYIFQNYRESLFPWMTAYENIAFPLVAKKLSTNEIDKKIKKIYKKFKVKFDLSDYPYELSGGQQQLIAIMRGFIDDPDLVLMDEPFSALDFQTSRMLGLRLQDYWLKSESTIIFISHDIREAIFLSDRIVLFDKNKKRTIKNIIRNNLIRPRASGIFTSNKFIKIEKKVLADLRMS